MHSLVTSLSATWQPFVLVAGLLLIGYSASREGLFDALGAWCARVPRGGVTLFVVTMLAVAVVSAVLNLDSAIVFMTPVALNAARAKGSDETAFIFGTVFMANSASLLLIGSNLTNILVIGNTSTSPAHFSARMALPWVVSVSVVIGVVLVWRWRPLTAPLSREVRSAATFTAGPGVLATVLAIVLMIVVRRPALEIFAAGVICQLFSLWRERGRRWREVLRVVSPVTLATLFVVAVAVGLLARHWLAPSHFMAHANVATTTLVATLSALTINNLPAASLFAAHAVAHPYALLLGLDVGPSCLITGALSSLLWRRIVAREGERVSLRTFSSVGLVVTVVTILLTLPILG